jgi:hypothetical protein
MVSCTASASAKPGSAWERPSIRASQPGQHALAHHAQADQADIQDVRHAPCFSAIKTGRKRNVGAGRYTAVPPADPAVRAGA